MDDPIDPSTYRYIEEISNKLGERLNRMHEHLYRRHDDLELRLSGIESRLVSLDASLCRLEMMLTTFQKDIDFISSVLESLEYDDANPRPRADLDN